MNKPVLKSYSFSIEFTAVAGGTAFGAPNIFQIPGNGVTVISPITRNVRIRGVEAYSDFVPRSVSTANAGYRANFWQLEFNIVDFAGQIIPEGGPFINLFVPETGLSVIPRNPYSLAINEVHSRIDCMVEGGGIFVSKLKASIGNVTNAVAFVWTTVITVWYEDLECN